MKASATLSLAAKAKDLKREGKDVISLSVGEPNWNSFQVAVDAGLRAIKEGDTKYMPSSGMLSLREAIVDQVNGDLGLNYTYAKFDFDQAADPSFEAGFNTPEHKVKLQFGKTDLFENFGFNINARWQNAFEWESTFVDGTIEARTVLDAQINYAVPSIKSIFKVGGANLTGQEYLSAPGVGAIGSQYYLSWTINN